MQYEQESRHARLSARARALRHGEATLPIPDGDEDAARGALRPLFALLQDDAPLGNLLLVARLEGALPEEAPEEGTGSSLVRVWGGLAPRLTELQDRRVWRDHLARLADELGQDAPADHPDAVAIAEARFWIGDRLATGPAALENVFLQVLFDLTCERGFREGWLPTWLEEAFALEEGTLEEELRLRREERALQRITHGPLAVRLPASMMPTIGRPVAALLAGDLDPDAICDLALEAALEDLDEEGRSDAALAFHRAAARAEKEGRPLAAYDLRLIFETLAEEGEVAERAALLLYARAIDEHLAPEDRRPW